MLSFYPVPLDPPPLLIIPFPILNGALAPVFGRLLLAAAGPQAFLCCLKLSFLKAEVYGLPLEFSLLLELLRLSSD